MFCGSRACRSPLICNVAHTIPETWATRYRSRRPLTNTPPLDRSSCPRLPRFIRSHSRTSGYRYQLPREWYIVEKRWFSWLKVREDAGTDSNIISNGWFLDSQLCFEFCRHAQIRCHPVASCYSTRSRSLVTRRFQLSTLTLQAQAFLHCPASS
jgi:hypothetical protein